MPQFSYRPYSDEFVDKDKDISEKTNQFRRMIQPANEDLQGLPLPPSPYPFKNPVTMTPDLDKSVRELRQRYAPGAGTAKTNVMQSMSPDIKYLSATSHPVDNDSLMSGNSDPIDHTLLGLAGTKDEDTDVYVAPKSHIKKLQGLGFIDRGLSADEHFDSTVAHELGHRNKPMLYDKIGAKESKEMSADHLEWLYRNIDPRTQGEYYQDVEPRPKKNRLAMTPAF